MIRIKNPTPARLPSEYQEVEYIEGTGTQYIDTNFYPSNNSKIELDFEWKRGTANANVILYGGAEEYCKKDMTTYLTRETGAFQTVYGTQLGTAVTTIEQSTRTVITKDKNKDYKNGTLVKTFTEETFKSPVSLYLFAIHRTGNYVEVKEHYVMIYACKIWENDVLTRDYIPCYRKSDNAVGMYDLVEKKFYGNAGTGTFLMGSAVANTTRDINIKPALPNSNAVTRLPIEYQEVEYIKSTGSQFINTGFKPNSNSAVEMQVSDCANDGNLFGAYNGSWTTGFGVYENKVSAKNFYIHYYSNAQVSTTPPEKYVVKLTQGDLYIDGVRVYDGSVKSFSVNYPMYLLGANNSGVLSAKSCKLYYCKVYDNDVLVRDFVPCYRNSDKVAGLYDLVNNQFYTNAGGGTFTVGKALNTREIPIKRIYVGDKLVYGDGSAKYEQLVNYTMLYDRGDECVDITGGWILYASTLYPCVRQKNADHLYIALSSGRGQYSGFDTQNTIDTQEYSQVMLFSTWTFTNKYWKSHLTGYFDYGNFDYGTTNFTRKIDVKPCLKDSRQFRVEGHGGDSGRGTFLVYSIALVKEDNWQELASKTGITASSIDVLLNNSATLLSNKNAVDYMIYNCTGTFMLSAIQSSTFLTALNNSAYKTTIQANEHWNKFLSMVA